MPMLPLTPITNFNKCFRSAKDSNTFSLVLMQVIKAESGEGRGTSGEGRGTSEASKTSEVKVEVKLEDSTKDNPDAVLIDEDQRKLFVGGLAQVFLCQFSTIVQPTYYRRPKMST